MPKRTEDTSSTTRTTINVAIAGVGNCASSLVQGVQHYTDAAQEGPGAHTAGIMNYDIAGYTPSSIRFVAAFDIDDRKVGRPITQAIFSPPNCTKRFCQDIMQHPGVVHMGHMLDGVAPHTLKYEPDRRIRPSRKRAADTAEILRRTSADVLLCYTPVGAEQAARHYAQAALRSRTAFINCVPVFIASTPAWEVKFRHRRIPIIGDDIKSQVGATIIHRALIRLFESRGISIDSTYQINVGGNTDFLNMLSRERLVSKKISKTESVQSQLKAPLPNQRIHIAPSDYIPFLDDNKVCFIRIEGRGFGNVPLHLEARLSVEDSPNSAAIVIDAIRCAKLALDRGIGGCLEGPSAYFMKHPPTQYSDEHAMRLTRRFMGPATTRDNGQGARAPMEQPNTYLHLIQPPSADRQDTAQQKKSCPKAKLPHKKKQRGKEG